MFTLKARIAAGISAGAVALALASSAGAVAVYDTITVYDPSSAVFSTITTTAAQQALNPAAITYLGGVGVDGGQFGNYGIVMASGIAIDIFGIASGGPDALDLAFAPGLTAQTYAVQNVVIYTGLPIDMTKYLDPALQHEGYTAFFTATGDFQIGVPEPATWALMIGGFGLAGATLRRRRTVAA